MAIRSHIDFFATLTPTLIAAVSAEEGRRVSRDETAARLTRELRAVVDRWTAYGAWVERVESDAWYADWTRGRQVRAEGRSFGRTSSVMGADARTRMSMAMRASWARRKAAARQEVA